MARKSKYTPELVKQITDTLAAGATIRDTCAYVGIDQKTYELWGKKYSDFSDATRKAIAQARVACAAVIRRAAIGGNVQAAQWYLERTDPENWGRVQRHILDVDPRLMKQLKATADAAGLSVSDLFEAMINEIAHADSPTNRAE